MSPDRNILFFHLIRSAVSSIPLTDDELAEYSPDLLQEFLSIAKKHDVAHLIVLGLKKNGLLSGENLALEKIMLKAAYRYERLNYEYKRICSALEEAEIPFIPLKGSVLRRFYPEPWMRTSCDIDVLVKEDDIDRAVSRLESIGFRTDKRNYHDVSMYSETNVLLELHFTICENIESMDKILRNVWNYAKPTENSMCEIDQEFFVFHIYAHMAYHFSSGGCGIRSLLDIWILKNQLNISRLSSNDLIVEAKILTFAEKIDNLVEVCFNGKSIDAFSELLLQYILTGGTYGSIENHIAVKKNRSNKNTFIFALKRLFLPYKSMAVLYPWLTKVPILLPFCWIARIFQALLDGKTKRAVSELSFANGLSDSKLSEIEYIFDKLEL